MYFFSILEFRIWSLRFFVQYPYWPIWRTPYNNSSHSAVHHFGAIFGFGLEGEATGSETGQHPSQSLVEDGECFLHWINALGHSLKIMEEYFLVIEHSLYTQQTTSLTPSWERSWLHGSSMTPREFTIALVTHSEEYFKRGVRSSANNTLLFAVDMTKILQDIFPSNYNRLALIILFGFVWITQLTYTY